jgi:hypothetical protein
MPKQSHHGGGVLEFDEGLKGLPQSKLLLAKCVIKRDDS